MENNEAKRRPDLDSAGWPQDQYSADLGHGPERHDAPGSPGPARTLGDHETFAGAYNLSDDELERLPILQSGTRLEQGSVYVDLNDVGSGPFKALGDQVATEQNRYVSKKDVDYGLWNDIVGRDEPPRIVRPDEES